MSIISEKSVQSFNQGFESSHDLNGEHHSKNKDITPKAKNILGRHQEQKSHKHQVVANYNELTIPPNWKLAENHAKARRTAIEQQDDDNELENNKSKFRDVCKCCGYEIQLIMKFLKERQDIDIYCDIMTLQFLGSGYPLFFNYIKYCIILLSWLFFVESAPILFTFSQGDFCNLTDFQVAQQQKYMEKNNIQNILSPCASNLPNRLSMANILNNRSYLDWQIYLTIICQVGIMLIMIYFRYVQIKVDNEVDEYLVTPADYTVLVKNIPRGLKISYETEIKKQFKEDKGYDCKINVEKVVLVYETQSLEKIEEEIREIIKKKKEILIEKNYDFDCKEIHEIDESIEKMEHELNIQKKKIINEPEIFFSGIAFVSFANEDMKQKVIQRNIISSWQRIKNFFNKGASDKLSDDVMYWKDRHLYIEQAPEPNDVDWEFINADTKSRLTARAKCNFHQFLVMFTCFSVTWIISFCQSKFTDLAFESMIEGKPGGEIKYFVAQCISILISICLVVFNKFYLGDIVHHIVDKEMWSTKTKLNISFAQKLTLSLFFNTAMITLAVEILTFSNYYGTGGMVSTETWVFFFNAFIPPLSWIINPWVLKKNKQRAEELEKASKNQSILTQQEANELMEGPVYVNGKRYADIMKTMWFTFLYSSMIPTGVLWSILGLIIYYWADKYNIIKRYTVKESLSKDLTIAMIDFLEYIVIMHAVLQNFNQNQFSLKLGDFFFKMKLFQKIDKVDILILFLATIYNLMMVYHWPCLIPSSEDEEEEYKDVYQNFDTDYDRENPVYKKQALKQWIEMRLKQAYGITDENKIAQGFKNAFGKRFTEQIQLGGEFFSKSQNLNHSQVSSHSKEKK